MKNNISFKIIENNFKIIRIDFLEHSEKNKNAGFETKKCRKEIEEYLSGKRENFDVKIQFSGTPFQERVWREMQKIPYGKTISYGELATRIGNPKAYRAVANACGKNPLPILIPCHRVVASDGLGGYSAGVEIKKKLLELEKRE